MQPASGHLYVFLAGIASGFLSITFVLVLQNSKPNGPSPSTTAPANLERKESPEFYVNSRDESEKLRLANLRYLDRLIEANPTDAELYLLRAYVSDQREADCTRAIELKPDNPEAYFMRTRHSSGTERLRDLDKAIELNPNYFDALSDRACVADDNLPRRISDYDRAARLNPYDNVLISHRFNKNYAAKNWDAAVRDYDYCSSKYLWTDTSGTCDWTMDMFDKLEAYQKTQDPKKFPKVENLIAPIDHIEAGYYYHKPADIQRGLAELNFIINMNPANTDARFLRALGYYLNREPVKSLEDVNKVISTDGFNLLSGRLRAQLLLGLGHHSEALRDLDAVLAISPNYTECYLAKAQCFAALNKPAEMEKALLGYCMRQNCDMKRVRRTLCDVSSLDACRDHIDLKRFDVRW